MKFLIDGHRDRVQFRRRQWPDGVAGQLLTPLTRYTRGEGEVFAIDNGAFSSFDEKSFTGLLRREAAHKDSALFVAVPDKVGCHKTTVSMYEDLSHLCDGWKKAFVVQDGFDGFPGSYDAVFVGGTTKFKDSEEVENIVRSSIEKGVHVHVGRVNSPKRFIKFHSIGAHTCDGSGVSRFDHMLEAIRQAVCEKDTPANCALIFKKNKSK